MKCVPRGLHALFMTGVFILVALSGCSPKNGNDAATTDQKSATLTRVPEMEELGSISYTGIHEEALTLVEGHWEGEPVEDGAASRPAVGLVEDFYMHGDLDGEWPPEAVITLWETSGGSGVNTYVAIVARRDGHAVNTATALVGDRVQLRAGRIADGRIELDLVQQGPNDTACCPTETVTRIWETGPDGLREVEQRNTGSLSLADIEGEEWQLEKMTRDEAVPDGLVVTLVFINDRISGRAGCNTYFGSLTAGDRPAEITPGKIGSTRMACPPAAMELENRYLQALSGVTGFGFLNGRLALIWQQEGVVSTLLFTPRDE